MRGGLKQCGSDRLEVERSLNAGFNPSSDENSFKLAVAELGRVGIEHVLTCIQRGEAEDAVPSGGGADFNAGGFVAQNDRYAGQWRRVEIGEAAGERAGLRRLNLNEMLPRRVGRVRLSQV
jgi:hypothetical protein